MREQLSVHSFDGFKCPLTHASCRMSECELWSDFLGEKGCFFVSAAAGSPITVEHLTYDDTEEDTDS